MTFHKFLGDSKMFEYDRHYRECQQLNKPFIKARIEPRYGNYFVQIDLMTCNYELSKSELDEIKKLTEKEIQYVNSKVNSTFSGFSLDKELAWFDGVSPEHVSDFCEKLYDLTQKHHS